MIMFSLHKYKLLGRSKWQLTCIQSYFLVCALVGLTMSDMQCKMLVSKFSYTKAFFSALTGRSNTTAEQPKVFWLLDNLSIEKRRAMWYQMYNLSARRDRISKTGSRSYEWPLRLSLYSFINLEYTVGSH